MSSFSLPSLPIELFPAILNCLEPTDWTALQLTSQDVRVKTRHHGARLLRNTTFVYSHEGLQKLSNITKDASLMSGLQRFTLRLWNPQIRHFHQDSNRSKTVKNMEQTWNRYRNGRDTVPSISKAESFSLYERHSQRQKLLRDSEEDLRLMNEVFENFAQFGVKLSVKMSDWCQPGTLVVGRPFDRQFFEVVSCVFNMITDREVSIPFEQTVQTMLKAATGAGVDLNLVAIHPENWNFLDSLSVKSLSSSQRASLANLKSFELHIGTSRIDVGRSIGFLHNLMGFMAAMTGLQQLILDFGFHWDGGAYNTPGEYCNYIPDLVLGLEFPRLHEVLMRYSKASATSLSGFLARHTTLQNLWLEDVSLVGGAWEGPFDTFLDLHELWFLHLEHLTVYNIDDGEDFYTAYLFPSSNLELQDALHVEDASEIPKALETVVESSTSSSYTYQKNVCSIF